MQAQRSSRSWSRCLTEVAVATVLGLVAQPSGAATVTWDNGGGDSKWSTNTNWSNDVAGIVTNDIALFNDTAVGASTMDKTSPFNISGLQYLNTAGTQTLDLNGNTLTLSGNLETGRATAGSAALISNGRLKPAARMNVGYSPTAANASGVLTIGTGSTTTTLDALSLTDIYIGHTDGGNTGVATGTLDLTNATVDRSGSKTLQLNNVYLGDNRTGNSGTLLLPASTKLQNLNIASNLDISVQGGTGHLGKAGNSDQLPDGLNVQLGTSTASRATLWIGRGGGTGAATGQLVAGTGSTFTGYLNQAWIGWSDGGASAGTLDLRNAAIGNGGTFDVNDLRVGVGATGKLLFSSATGAGQLSNLTVNSQLVIGQGNDGLTGRIGSGATGDGDLPAGLNFHLGTSTSSRASVDVGRDGNGPVGSNGRMSLGANSTLQGYVSELNVGYPTQTYHVSTGLVDLRRATLTGAGLDVGTAVRVGAGAGKGSGQLYLGPSPSAAVVAKSPLVQVGEGGTGSSTATGLLDLTGTRFQISGTTAKSLDIRATGDAVVHVGPAATGFDILSANAGVLNIDSGGQMKIVFENYSADRSTEPFWGLRMAGDQQTLLNTYIGANNSSSAIWYYTTVNNPAAWVGLGVHYDVAGNFTYIGLPIPEPGALGLLGLSGLALLRRRRDSDRPGR